MRTRHVAVLAIGLAFTLAACSDGGTPAGDNPGPGGDSAVSGADGFEGSLATSGVYVATWTASPEAQADVFNSVNPLTITSDHQTFGHVSVQLDGGVSFGSAAPELAPNLSFAGSGATVTMDKSGRFVCAFSVDTDLAGGNDGAKLHIKGDMKVHWHPEGIGDISCP